MSDKEELIGGGHGNKEESLSSSFASQLGLQVVHQRQRKPEQTLVLFFNALFKILALILYMFGSKIGFISSFVFVVLFLSADFWFVKNVSGRLLAGLRWRNLVSEDNTTEWRFESWSPEERSLANPVQIKAFWAFLIAHEVLWSVILIAALFGLHLIWIMIPILALVLNSSNTYGYVRCWWEAKSEKASESSRFASFTPGMVKNAWASLKSFVINPRGTYSSVPLDETVLHQ